MNMNKLNKCPRTEREHKQPFCSDYGCSTRCSELTVSITSEAFEFNVFTIEFEKRQLQQLGGV
jgi:hypothetical protein